MRLLSVDNPVSFASVGRLFASHSRLIELARIEKLGSYEHCSATVVFPVVCTVVLAHLLEVLRILYPRTTDNLLNLIKFNLTLDDILHAPAQAQSDHSVPPSLACKNFLASLATQKSRVDQTRARPHPIHRI